MARPSVGAIVVGLVLFGAALSGCTGFPIPDDVATYEPDGPGGADAAMTGILVREDGCTYVEDPASGLRTLPVFEAGSVMWSDDTLIVRNQSYKVGDTVTFGGGGDGQGSTLAIDVPDACDASAGRWLVN
ncbi:hypothetical protein BH09ACT4_BH09ACT4_15600 [soil metagenome]